jgi:hypothetical protein
MYQWQWNEILVAKLHYVAAHHHVLTDPELGPKPTG